MANLPPDDDLLVRLHAAQTVEERGWLVTEDLLKSLQPTVREAAWAAAVPHWFDAQILAALLERPEVECFSLYAELQLLPFVEPFEARGGHNVHARTRAAMLDHLWGKRVEEYINYSARAADYFAASDEPTWQIERAYHLLISAPDAQLLLSLEREWTERGEYDLLFALRQTEWEHLSARRVRGRSRASTYLKTWIVPGAPLEGGRGWRIWYSQPGHADFRPPPVTVLRNQQPEAAAEAWRLLPDLPELDRRMGVLTVTLETPHPGEVYDIRVPGAGLPEPFRWRSLPSNLGEESVSFLLASCFWRDSDREATYSVAMRRLAQVWKPAFQLLVGNQVYTDWPVDWSERGVKMYAQRYAQYWGDPAYQALMQTSPTFFTCGAHEFWNDYPERQLHLPWTWAAQRGHYGDVARQLYERYQQCANPGGKSWYRFTIEPVSFFVTDCRSQRDLYESQHPCHFFQEPQWKDLEQWARELRGPGVLVLSQPLFQKDGDWRDHSLSNFTEDYGRLWSIIEGSLRGENDHERPHDILVLAGGITTGRFAVGYCSDLDAPVGVPELIASPASMITPAPTEPELPPERVVVRHKGRTAIWVVRMYRGERMPTICSNVGLIRMRPGTSGRVLFDLSLWRVRPYDARSWWDRMVGEAPLSGAVIPLFHTEIELR